jgi:hypothetical protein
VAATVVVGVGLLFNSFRGVEPEPARVASIQKSFGSIYVLGDQSELTRADNLAAIHEGQIIVTGDDAGIALAWVNGGSVRLDKSTEIEFRDDSTVYLRSGRVYFDSRPSELFAEVQAGGENSFVIETDHGVVMHTGTQFMTHVDDENLRVSVREGRVDISGQFYPHTAERGEQVLFSGRQRPVVLSIPEYGAAWDWIGKTSPPVNVEGQSVHVFLDWVGRELGMSIEYAGDDVAQVARQAILEGQVGTEPKEALRHRMMTAALSWRFEEGVIYVNHGN